MKTSFDEIIEVVLHHEGGYVNDPKDPGGETNYGISKRAYPDVDIKNLTEDGAKDIYRRDYWEKYRCVMNFPKASDTFILICVLIWVLVVQQR